MASAEGSIDFPLAAQYIYGSATDKCHLQGLFSDEIKEIRFAFLPYETEATVTSYNDYLTGDGWETRTYTLIPGKAEIDIPFDGTTRYGLAAICFDSNGKSVYDRVLLSYIYSNYRGSDTWHSIGTGSLTEKISYIVSADKKTDENGAVEAKPWTYDVEVEVCDSNPALIRIKNPFGPTHPNFANLPYIDKGTIMQHFPTLQGDDYYLVFDCSDPSRVRLDYSLCGLDLGTRPIMAFSGPRNLQGWDKWADKDVDREYPWEWGKYRENAIVFNSGSIFMNHTNVEYANPNQRDLTLRLPAWVNYEFSMEKYRENDDLNNDLQIRFYDIAPDVASFDCALISETERINNRFFEENLYKRLREKDPALDIHTYKASESLLVPLKDLGPTSPGIYYFIALSRDAEGNPHRGHYVGTLDRYVSFSPSRWEYLGKAYFAENVMASIECIGLDEYTCFVDLYQCPGLPGYYALDNPYKALADKSDNVVAIKNHAIYINATDPETVHFNYANMRSMMGGHEILSGLYEVEDKANPAFDKPLVFYSNYNFHARQFWNNRVSIPLSGCSYYAGTLDDSVIRFDAVSISNTADEYGPVVTPGLYMTIALPQSGIEHISVDETDGNGTDVYFNLQGIRVDNPSHGLYLRVRANKTEKVLVR